MTRKRLVLSNVYKKIKREKIQNFHTLNSPPFFLPFFLSFFLSFFDETPNFHLAFAKQTRRRTFLYKEEEEEEEEEKNVHETKNVREKIQRTMRLCSHDDDDDEYDEREGILIGAFFFALQK
tara:strand:+ start:170 stop:535 length:366 start_codon:yes stop_codon:yes gene_type:complete